MVFPPSKTEMCKAKVCLKRVDEPNLSTLLNDSEEENVNAH